MTVSRLAALAATLALAVAAAGCGGSDTQSKTEAWADGMCSALVDWQNSVQTAGEKVSKGDLSKSSLQGAANGVSDANKQLRDDQDSLGKPPTETADKPKTDHNQHTHNHNTKNDKIREALGNSGSDVTAAITAVSGSVQAMSQDVQNTATQLKALESDDTWKKAFNSSDSCQKLSG